jgi:hypothetical protein
VCKITERSEESRKERSKTEEGMEGRIDHAKEGLSSNLGKVINTLFMLASEDVKRTEARGEKEVVEKERGET